MIIYGPSINQTEFDTNIFQGHDSICAIRCQEIIMRDYGIQIPTDELVQFAKDKGWYSEGTKESAIGNLLEICNIDTHTQHCHSVYDLINELKDGHRVIVSVDSRELWAEPGSKEYEFYRNLPHADHALIVTSINIDPLNPERSTVVLTDPGKGTIMEYDLEKFARSWKDSNYFMMATDEPAPYQYNAETRCMEFSNFATNFIVHEFPFHNYFTNIWKVNELGYVPYYDEGHLDFLTEDISYDDFNNAFSSESFSSLDDSFNMMGVEESYIKVDFSESDMGTELP